MSKKVILIGAGGHAKVVLDIILKNGDEAIGFLDDTAKDSILGYPILGKINDCVNYKDAFFIISIGNNYIREKIASEFHFLQFHTAVHPSAEIGMNVILDKGSVIMANAVINTDTKIGKHSIINTAAVVEHDNILGNFTHVSPHATLCGTVTLGDFVSIGAGSVVKNNIKICSDVTIGCGAAVVKNIIESGTYTGVPIRKL